MPIPSISCLIRALFLKLFCLSNYSIAADVELTISMKKPKQGVLFVELYKLGEPVEGKYEWQTTESIKSHTFPLDMQGNTETYHLKNLKLGALCIRTFLDLNGNQKLDRSPMGIPKEPVGFANNPVLMLGEPEPDEACFVLKEKVNKQHIKLQEKRRKK